MGLGNRAIARDTPAVREPGVVTAPSWPGAGTDGRAPTAWECDEHLSHIFQDLRLLVALPPQVLAERIGTTPEMLGVLESGRIADFPEGPEFTRIVHTYAGLARIDPRPILGRAVMLRLMAPPPPLPPPRPPAPVVALNAASASVRTNALVPVVVPARQPLPVPVPAPTGGELRRRGRGRRLLAVTFPVALLAAAGVLLTQRPSALYQGAAMLPEPLSTLARLAVDVGVAQTAPVIGGLRWIDVGDPRLRKTDKLPGNSR
jgi:hypothetical protein